MTQQATGWRDQTRQLLNDRPQWLKYDQISTDTGLTVAWLRDFASGKTENPGVVYVETLFIYLSNKAK